MKSPQQRLQSARRRTARLARRACKEYAAGHPLHANRLAAAARRAAADAKRLKARLISTDEATTLAAAVLFPVLLLSPTFFL
jgi:hypothetical protein